MEKYEQAELDYIAGMKYKEIAEKYNTSVNTVKSWKQRYNWVREKRNSRDSKKECAHKIKKCAHKKSKVQQSLMKQKKNRCSIMPKIRH